MLSLPSPLNFHAIYEYCGIACSRWKKYLVFYELQQTSASLYS